jgi:hypothetical protein
MKTAAKHVKLVTKIVLKYTYRLCMKYILYVKNYNCGDGMSRLHHL